MSETARRERDPFALTLAFGLMAAAFAGSYTHVVEATSAWGQRGWMAYAIAAMPEVTVIIGMRRVLTGTMTMIMWVFLASAGVFTLAGNLNSAQHSVFGVIAAAWPAWSAIGALIFAGVHAKNEDKGQTTSETVIQLGRRRTTTTPRAKVAPVSVAVGQVLDEPHDGQIRTITGDPVGRPEVTAGGVSDPRTRGHNDLVSEALLAEWTPGQALTKEIKNRVMVSAGVSDSTVKRTAREIRFKNQVTS